MDVAVTAGVHEDRNLVLVAHIVDICRFAPRYRPKICEQLDVLGKFRGKRAGDCRGGEEEVEVGLFFDHKGKHFLVELGEGGLGAQQ